MDPFWIALVAGFVATAVLSAMMLMKRSMRLMPEMDMIGMNSGMMGVSRGIGWMLRFVVGTVVYGLAFLWVFSPIWPDGYWLGGAVLGLVGWLIAMLMMMPMAGNGVFGMKLGAKVPMMSLVMHVVCGAVLGLVYGWPVG